MKKDRYEKGDILCDMHDRFAGLPDNLRVKNVVATRTDLASQFVQQLNNGKHPGNKYLVVVDLGGFGTTVVAAYAYDNHYFGMVELEYVDHGE